MGKWGKYLKKYQKSWEKDKDLKDWLEPNSEENVINKNEGEAYCRVCHHALRAHHGDLLKHGKTSRHRDNMTKFNPRKHRRLDDFGARTVTDDVKRAEMKVAEFIAMHASVKTMDHLGELLAQLGTGSVLQNVKCHRTKCSRLIDTVIAPAHLQELLADVGVSPYSLIVDEVTDISVSKFMGVCIRYYSRKYRKMVTDFLGLVPVTLCTGEALAVALLDYLEHIGLNYINMKSVGTDGAPNMCGVNNSFYTHLRVRIPKLTLFKCVCHSIDKCAEHAFHCMPDSVYELMNATTNWFAYSSKRLDEYMQYFKTMNNGKPPRRLVSLSKTRWLVWVPCSDVILEQWDELRGFFALKGEGSKGDAKCKELTILFSGSNKLYLLALRNILSGVQKVSKAFERTDADVTKLYADLRSQILVLAGRILKAQSIAQAARPGMLRRDEAQMLKTALNDKQNSLPVDRISLGDSFARAAVAENVPAADLSRIQFNCGKYIHTLCNDLLDKLPSNLDGVEKLKFMTPRMALARSARPTFQQLPLEMTHNAIDRDTLESQWNLLGTMTLPDILLDGPETELNVDEVDIVRFWGSLLELKNAGGEHAFRELAEFALSALTIPISNAVVERVFSVLGLVKCRRRNKLQLRMLESLIRVRVHLKVLSLCCIKFEPTPDMYSKFTADMYRRHVEADPQPQAEALHYELVEEENTDDPDPMLAEDGVLQDIDYEIVNEIDTEHFNEYLLVP